MKIGNNTEDMNIDDLQIKSHLNASFDVSGISLSEELIQKTLRAINEQSPSLADKEDNVLKTRRLPWNSYVRNLTAVAAALMVLIGGYSLIKNSVGMKSSKNDSKIFMENNSSMDYDRSTEMAMPEARGDISGEDYGLYSTKENDTTDVTMGSATGDTTFTSKDIEDEHKMDIAAIDDSLKSNDQEKAAPSATSEFTSTGLKSVEFTQIYWGSLDMIESMIITDEAAGKSVIITEESELSMVYSLLDSYWYSAAESGLSSDIYYVIEIKEKQSDVINTIIIGDTVTISSDTGVTDSTQAYEMINLEEFNRELKVLIESYSN